MAQARYLVAKAERDLSRDKSKHDQHEKAKLVALSTLSGAALAKILANTAIGAGVSAGGRALFRTGRKTPVRPAPRPMFVDMPPPPRQLIMPVARRTRS